MSSENNIYKDDIENIINDNMDELKEFNFGKILNSNSSDDTMDFEYNLESKNFDNFSKSKYTNIINLINDNNNIEVEYPKIDGVSIDHLKFIKLRNDKFQKDGFINFLILEKLIKYCEDNLNEKFFEISKLKSLSKNQNILTNLLISQKKLFKKLKIYDQFIFSYLKLTFFLFIKSEKSILLDHYNYDYLIKIFNLSRLSTNINLDFIIEKEMSIVFYDLKLINIIIQLFSIEWKNISFNEEYLVFLDILLINLGYQINFNKKLTYESDEQIKIIYHAIMYYKMLLFIDRFFIGKNKDINNNSCYNLTFIGKNKDINNNNNNKISMVILNQLFEKQNINLKKNKKFIINFVKKNIEDTNDFKTLEKFELCIKEQMILYHEKLSSMLKMKKDNEHVKPDKNTKIDKLIIVKNIIKYSQRKSEFNPISNIFTTNNKNKIFEIYKHIPNLNKNIMGYLYIITIDKYLKELNVSYSDKFIFFKIDLLNMYINNKSNNNILIKSTEYPIIVELINKFIVIYDKYYLVYDNLLYAFQHQLILFNRFYKNIEKIKDNIKDSILFFLKEQ